MNRHPAGIPTGGQFAPESKGRADVSLDIDTGPEPEWFDNTKALANGGKVQESREAHTYLAAISPDTHLVVQSDGRDMIVKAGAGSRSDGKFGSFESYSVPVNLRPGGYSFRLTNHGITSGKQKVRPATPAEVGEWTDRAAQPFGSSAGQPS